jgi:hypothetical protein
MGFSWCAGGGYIMVVLSANSWTQRGAMMAANAVFLSVC